MVVMRLPEKVTEVLRAAVRSFVALALLLGAIFLVAFVLSLFGIHGGDEEGIPTSALMVVGIHTVFR
jgi:hypothetical protein